MKASLSPLEIKELDAIGKDKAEQKSPGNMSSCNYTKEVIIKPQVIFEIILHCHVCSAGNGHRSCFVTDLRRNEAVYGPGDGGSPIVPPPPHRDLLRAHNIKRSSRN